MARVFSLTMNKYKGKKERNPSNIANKNIIYAIFTGLSGVITSVFMKIIQRNVKVCSIFIQLIIYIFVKKVHCWADRNCSCKWLHVVRTDKMFTK